MVHVKRLSLLVLLCLTMCVNVKAYWHTFSNKSSYRTVQFRPNYASFLCVDRPYSIKPGQEIRKWVGACSLDKLIVQSDNDIDTYVGPLAANALFEVTDQDDGGIHLSKVRQW